MVRCFTKALATVAAAAITLPSAGPAFAGDSDDFKTATPIKHIVVIFQENFSFDHYFGTYPHAANLAGERPFHAKDDTPRVNGLESSGLLMHNANSTQRWWCIDLLNPPPLPGKCNCF